MIGADPEFFLTDDSDSLVSAIPFIAGNKEIQLMVDGGGLQHDNVAAEFSCDPTESEDAFVGIMGSMLLQLAKHVHPNKVNATQSADFPEKELQSLEAQAFGCDPDFDAYTVRMNIFDNTVASSSLRSCGGHIHVGVKDGFPKILAEGDPDVEGNKQAFGKIRLVKSMDLFLGSTSLLLDSEQAASRRRELYGKAGSHRPKDYGVEYRTLSNFWTKHPDLVRLTYRLTALSIEACETGYDKECFKALGETDVGAGEALLRKTIDNSNVPRANDIVNRFVIPKLKTETLSIFNKAIKNVSGNIYKNWALDI